MYNCGDIADPAQSRILDASMFLRLKKEMDYKTFLDFVLAMENKKTPQSLHYFWRILDVFHKGAIDTFVINMFFRQVISKLE